MKLRFRYVRDRAATAHIWDHINDRQDHALCGRAYHDPIELAEGSRPPSVCRDCQALAPQAEAALWKQLAEDSTKTLRKTEREYRKLAAEYEALWTEYESYVADYDTLYNDYEGLDNEYESLWTEYERLWTAYEHLGRC